MNWNRFNVAAMVGGLVLILISPLWGHFIRELKDTYNFDTIYSVYLIAIPFILYWGAIIGRLTVYYWNKK